MVLEPSTNSVRPEQLSCGAHLAPLDVAHIDHRIAGWRFSAASRASRIMGSHQSSKECDHFGWQDEQHAHRYQESNDAEYTDREKVGIKRLIADTTDAHVPPPRFSCVYQLPDLVSAEAFAVASRVPCAMNP